MKKFENLVSVPYIRGQFQTKLDRRMKALCFLLVSVPYIRGQFQTRLASMSQEKKDLVSVPYIRGQFQTMIRNSWKHQMILKRFRPLYTGLVSNWKLKFQEFESIQLFPSPIYGASFKLEWLKNEIREEKEFPSPIYGASFKPCALEPASLLG